MTPKLQLDWLRLFGLIMLPVLLWALVFVAVWMVRR